MPPRAVLAAVVAAVVAALALGACAPTARTGPVYESKAADAAEGVHSAVSSDMLLVESVRRRHTTAAFVSVAAAQAEERASSAQASFLSIQPPDEDSDRLRTELSQLLDDALDALAFVRVAGRRDDHRALLDSARQLEDVAQRLQDFEDAHQ